MKKKILIVVAILIFVILAGAFIYSYSIFGAEKKEAFSLAIKVCERNIEIGEKLERYIEQLEDYEKNGFEGYTEIRSAYIDELKVIKTELQKRCETDCKYMYDLLKNHTKISESGVKMALESYLYSENCLFEACFSTYSSLGDEEHKQYNEYMKTAKKELKFGKEFFEGYLNKLKN